MGNKPMTKLTNWIDRQITHERALVLVTIGVLAGTFLGDLIPQTHLNSFLLTVNLLWIWE